MRSSPYGASPRCTPHALMCWSVLRVPSKLISRSNGQLVIQLVTEEFIDEHAGISERVRDPSKLADEQRVCLPSPFAKPTPLHPHQRVAGAVPVARRAGPSRLLRAVGRASGFLFGTRAASLFPFFTSRVFWTRGGGQHGAASLPELGSIDQRHPRRSVIAPGQHALSIR